ncbi:VanZ family protein [Virgibacillus ainsalahensis]
MRNYLYWLLPLIWMGVIFYSSATPYENQDIKPLLNDFPMDLSFLEPVLGWISFTYHQSVVSVDALGVTGFIEFFIRKGAHVGVFLLLMCLFYLAFHKSTGLRFKTTLLFSFLLTVAYAVIDEFHQGFTPNRTPYIGDVFLDSFGALLASGILILIHWLKSKK